MKLIEFEVMPLVLQMNEMRRKERCHKKPRLATKEKIKVSRTGNAGIHLARPCSVAEAMAQATKAKAARGP